MAKLAKQYYYKRNGEKRINCYHVNIPKDIVSKVYIDEDDDIVVYDNYDEIVIKKKYHCICEECGCEWDSGKPYDIKSICPRCGLADIRYCENGK